MKHTAVLLVAAVLAGLHPRAFAQPRTGLFAGGYAAADFDKSLGASANTTDFVRNSFIGRFDLQNKYYLANYDDWSVTLQSYIQFLWGGLKQRRAKLYAGSFDISLAFRHRLPFYHLYAQTAVFHVSTHYIDPIDAASIDEARDLQQIYIEVEDVNLIRVDIGQEEADYAWTVGTQPIRMNFFLLAEPKEMFASDAFTPYERRFYANALATVWRSENYRLALQLDTELEQRARYLVRITGSTNLGDTPHHDRIQLSLAYQGGIEPNHIVVVPQSGISREGLTLGASFYF